MDPGSNREIIDCGNTYYGCYRDGKFDGPVAGLAGILDLVPTYDGVFEMRSEREWEHNKWSQSGEVLSCQIRDVLSILVRQSSPSLIRYDGYLTLTARSQCIDEDGVLVPGETSPFASRETRPT